MRDCPDLGLHSCHSSLCQFDSFVCICDIHQVFRSPRVQLLFFLLQLYLCSSALLLGQLSGTELALSLHQLPTQWLRSPPLHLEPRT